MKNTQRKEYQLPKKDIEYVESVAEKYGIQTSVALSKIISDHQDFDTKWMQDNMKIIISLLYSIRKLDRVNIEILNSICMSANYQMFTPTNTFKAEIVEQSFSEINKEIASKNIKKAYTK
jgi:hypothetical protein